MLSKILMIVGWRRRPRAVGDLSIYSRRALPQKSGSELIYEANAVSDPKVIFYTPNCDSLARHGSSRGWNWLFIFRLLYMALSKDRFPNTTG